MAKTVEFKYAPMFQMGKDDTEYRLLTKEGVTLSEFEGKERGTYATGTGSLPRCGVHAAPLTQRTGGTGAERP